VKVTLILIYPPRAGDFFTIWLKDHYIVTFVVRLSLPTVHPNISVGLAKTRILIVYADYGVMLVRFRYARVVIIAALDRFHPPA
jgi:hypothetical protein